MRLRFTIRDLLWLTVVVALAVGWWVDHGKFKTKTETMQMQVGKLEMENHNLRSWREPDTGQK